MSGGFWAGSIPPWACVTGFCLILLAGSFGVWVGWGLGEEAEQKAAAAELEAEQAIAAIPERPLELAARPGERTMIPVEYRPVPVPGLGTAIWARSPEVGTDQYGNAYPPYRSARGPGQAQFEAAHEAWLAHEEQALAVANDGKRWCESCWRLHDGECGPPAPDPRTDSQWTADMAADMGRFLDGLLNAHPATEEL